METNNDSACIVILIAGILIGLFFWLFENSSTNQPVYTGSQFCRQPERYSYNSSFRTQQSYFRPSSFPSDFVFESRRGIELRSIPKSPGITNLNSLLQDIYVRYVGLKADDFELHYNIFDKFSQRLHQTMKDVDPYYKKYSSTFQTAGSHFDRLRINKPDEFDMDIILRLPVNMRHNPLKPEESDIIIEPKRAGFLHLKMGKQFQMLPFRDDWEINKTAYGWMDSNNYLLRSKFLNWFKSVVIAALNRFEKDEDTLPTFVVDDTTYTIETSESGPAITLILEDYSNDFHLDIDLVPALRFPEDRWPIGNGYREIPVDSHKGEWMVVGKPDTTSYDLLDMSRTWRIALHNQERELMYGTYNLRHAMKFLKKVRDSQSMNEIASYYIKTLFYWEIVERNDKKYWLYSNPATIFKLMVNKFHDAIVNGNIPYFWNEENNLIANVPWWKLSSYGKKLAELMKLLEYISSCEDLRNWDGKEYYKAVAKYLLSSQEYMEYEELIN